MFFKNETFVFCTSTEASLFVKTTLSYDTGKNSILFIKQHTLCNHDELHHSMRTVFRMHLIVIFHDLSIVETLAVLEACHNWKRNTENFIYLLFICAACWEYSRLLSSNSLRHSVSEFHLLNCHICDSFDGKLYRYHTTHTFSRNDGIVQ